MYAIAAIIIAAIGAAIAGYSAYSQSRASEKASEYNAEVAENQAAWSEYNAKAEADQIRQQVELYEYNAVLAEQAAADDAQDAEERKQRLLATQATRYGKSGLLLEGTPLEVMSISSLEADKDIESILYEGGLEAWNWRTKGEAAKRGVSAAEISGVNLSSTYRAEAALNTMKGETAKSQGLLTAGSTIATGAANAAYLKTKASRKVPTWSTDLDLLTTE